jgi:hypothetical protein
MYTISIGIIAIRQVSPSVLLENSIDGDNERML